MRICRFGKRKTAQPVARANAAKRRGSFLTLGKEIMDPIIATLPTKKTWRFVLLSFFTYFVYPAHYVKTLSARLNEQDSEAPKISTALVWAVLISSYISLAFFFGYIAVEEDHPIAKISTLVDKLSGLIFLIWTFSARSRIHALLKPSKGSSRWLHGFWTFVFGPFYLNYKLSKLKNENNGA